MKSNRFIVLLVLCLSLVVAAGCSKNNTPPTPSNSDGSMSTMDHSTMDME